MSIYEKLKAFIESIKNKIAKSATLTYLVNEFKKANIIPPNYLTDIVLRKVVINFIRKAESKGWTAGIDLPENEIAEYIIRIIRAEGISFKEQSKANQVMQIINRSIFTKDK